MDNLLEFRECPRCQGSMQIGIAIKTGPDHLRNAIVELSQVIKFPELIQCWKCTVCGESADLNSH